MSRNGRLLAIAAALVVLAIAFVVLSPGGDDEPATTGTTASTTAATTASTPTSTAPAPPPPQKPKAAKVVVRDGKPVGGVERIEVKKGERALIEVSSPDTSDEIHLHGYDLKRDLSAGGSVRFMFTADADGIYEIELEGAGVQIGELVVEP